MFGTIKLVRNAIKSEFNFNGQATAFQRAAMLNVCDGFARSIVTYGIDYSLTSHADNRKNNFLVLGEAPTQIMILINLLMKLINDSTGAAEKKSVLILVKKNTKICWS